MSKKTLTSCCADLPALLPSECSKIYLQNSKTLKFYELKPGEKRPVRSIEISFVPTEEEKKKEEEFLLWLHSANDVYAIDTLTGEKFKLTK